jgi:hypothetical protein
MKDQTLTRLRAANPYPVVAGQTDSALFARITALPGDERLGRRSRTRQRRALVLVLAVVIVALLASTAFAISNWVVGGAVKPPVTRNEYREAQRELTLPPGYTWPPLYVPEDSVTGVGAGGGHAVLVAMNSWECYWVQAIDEGDMAAQRRARGELETLLDRNVLVAPIGAPEDWTPPNPPLVPYATFAHDGGVTWIRETHALAAAGHPQRLRETCRANAPR